MGRYMEHIVPMDEGIESWNTTIFLYNSALKEVKTKLEILNDEFQQVHQYNPIEYVKARIKTPESIVKKLKRYGKETSIENMINYINDIAGIRIVCSFTSDIYKLAEMIGKQKDLTVVSVKDYIKNHHPQESSVEARSKAGSSVAGDLFLGMTNCPGLPGTEEFLTTQNNPWQTIGWSS